MAELDTATVHIYVNNECFYVRENDNPCNSVCDVNIYDVFNQSVTHQDSDGAFSQDGAFNDNLSVNCTQSCNNPETFIPQNSESCDNQVNTINEKDPLIINDLDPYKLLAEFCKTNLNKISFSHLNVNSLPNKYMELHNIFENGTFDIIFLSETKLDSSFTNAQFSITNYCTYRQDRNTNGGGILCYVNQKIPHRNRTDIAVNCNGIESIVIHVKLNKISMFFICVYKPPNVNNDHLKCAIEEMLNQCNQQSEYVYIIGDMNINFMNNSNALTDTLISFDLKQMIKEPTCFKSVQNPTLIDIILTNKAKSIAKTINVPLGISDFHNYIGGAIKMPGPKDERQSITYRSFKNFKDETYLNDLETAPFHVSQVFEDVDDQLWFHNKLLLNIIDKNAPTKQRLIKCNQLPYMNDRLRKAINVKAMLRRKYQSFKSQQTWLEFKKQRNLVNKLKRTSIREYFEKNCVNNQKNSKHFWDVIKPFITDKTKSNYQNIMLYEGNSLISDPHQVANTFNKYFINVTDDTRESEYVSNMEVNEIISHYENHPSIKLINDNQTNAQSFNFGTVCASLICKKLKCLKTKKASGFDNISPKFLKIAATNLSLTLTPIINNSITSMQYPDHAKRAIVSPLFKKSDQLDKANYRPLSILPSTSKLFEGVICEQITNYMSDFLSKDLSAYRKHYSCNNVLVNCIEHWRKALDNNQYVGCILIDLSKAFDSLPHGLMIAKLHAYGFSIESCKYVLHYLSNRKQAVKIGSTKSNWQELKTGVPQGSLTGPLLFNIFINDFILQLRNTCSVYNYADDNTLAYSHSDPEVIKFKLEEASNIAIKWFNDNFMKANPSKFQAICFGKNDLSLKFTIANNIIKTEQIVKLLGVELDNKLSFNQHVSLICKKAARQLNAMYRISKNLDYDSRMKIYESFIMSNFIYCSAAYNNLNSTNDRKIEKLNKRSLRLVCNNYTCSYSELLKLTGKFMLYVYRKFHMIEHVYKTLNNLALPIEPNFFERQTTNYNLRDDNKLKQPNFKTVTYGFRSISCQGPILWNKLPNDVKNVADFSSFKTSIRKCSIFTTCQCGSCIVCLKDNI